MRVATLIEHSAELIRIIFNSSQPVDRILSTYFRSKKQYGSKERKFSVNTIYLVLRNYLLFEFIGKNIQNEIQVDKSDEQIKILIAITLTSNFPNFTKSYSPDELIINIEKTETSESILQSILGENLAKFKQTISTTFEELNKKVKEIDFYNFGSVDYQLIQNRYSFPAFFLEKIINSFRNRSELMNFLENSIEQAPLVLRVNTLKTTTEHIEKNFNEQNIPLQKSIVIPNCFYSSNRIQLSEIPAYKNGEIEVQEEGSQLISLILSPKANEEILDACAGAGGKTIHIGDLQKNQGLIIANDIEFKRLKEIPKRAQRAGLTSVITYISNSKKNNFKEILKLTKEHLFHRVLIDAPCTGSGTIRRDPLKKFRINEKILKKINLNQIKILENYSKFVRINGFLVYSTCSLIPDENEFIVEQFLENNPNFIPVNILEDIDISINTNFLRIHQNQVNIDFRNTISDGFFMAKMMRID
ncbi:MAG: hypothetical protein A2X64_06175 [Ignavibacteria bacterium GWF2_33_9]|nr:MAG: hypothetical protein A2X64_06175 [Ignavibacteria bacterium GWF2_33_9]